jgi:predicted Zn-dependent protease
MTKATFARGRSSAAALWLIVVLASSALARAQIFGMSEAQEIELGRQAAAEVERTQPLLDDTVVNAYIKGLGLHLVEYCGRPNIEYHFKVIDTPEVNAFALPGGFVYVNRGLIEKAGNESELAGVLAHEIGHVVGRHSVEQVKRAQLTGLGLGVLDMILGGRGTAASIANMASQMVASGAFMKYSRDAEREADRLGARNLYDAGFDPRGMVTFFQKLDAMRKREPNVIEAFFSTHPSPDERVKNVSDLIRSFPPKEGPFTDSGKLEQIQARLK